MKHWIALLAALWITALIPGCVENTEVITVKPDGSIEVEVAAKSDHADDLTDGYAVPLDGPWSPADEITRRWIRSITADTGSEAAREALAARMADWKGETRLAARAVFESVRDWPDYYATTDEPYRTAFLRRTADLRIEKRGDSTVYVFERVFHHRIESHPVWTAILEKMPDGVVDKIEEQEDLTDDEWRKVVSIFQEEFLIASRAFVRDALVGVYTRGDASIPTATHAEILADVDRAIRDHLSTRHIRDMIDASVAYDEAERNGEDPDEEYPLLAFEQGTRDVTRTALTLALESRTIRKPVVHAILERLEWNFTARDHTDDLGDESFKIAVAMPGTIVGGNWLEMRNGHAIFEFDGGRLSTGDVRIRVVSVVEPGR